MLTCQELIDFLDRYLAGELPLAQRLAFKAHLGLCRACRNYVDSYEKTVQVTKAALRQEGPPAAPPEALVEAVLKARRKE